MAIKDLLELIGKQNIAEDIEQDELDILGMRVKRQFDEDWTSMSDWIEGVDEGSKLLKQEFRPKSTPWEGASNFKSPLLSEASIAFGDKASLEILRARNLVKADIIGKDNSGEKKKLADRVTEAMNYQINYQMSDWRKDQKRLLYTLPNVGCAFKRTVYDPLLGQNVSHIIQYPDFAVNQATTSLDKSRAFTQILNIDQNGVIERQASGIWSDIDIYPEEVEGDEGSNESAGTTDSESNPDRFLEQQCFYDFDKDGIEEPYTVTIHEQTMKVVRVIPRYDERSFVVQAPSKRIMTLVEVLKQKTKDDVKSGTVSASALPDIEDIEGFKLIRINPIQPVTKYGFIPSPDGTFLDLGYSHLLGAITQAVNSTTNQLTDSGTIRNVGGGFLAKGFRKKMGPMRLKPGDWKSTDIKAADLRNGMMPNPNPEPSQVLFALNDKLEQQGRNFAAIVDAGGQIQANTAPTTALAIIQEALISTSALMGRVIDGMSEEFQVMFNLNKRVFDPELYKEILDDQEASAIADFNNESLDIMPTASPEMSSKLQRMQLSVAEMEQLPNVIQAGGNPTPIVKSFFERIGSNNIDEIFPENPTDAQLEEMQRFTQAQEQENAIAKSQLDLNQLQTEILSREQDRLDADTKRKIDETIGQLTRWQAQNILDMEKAETEDTKNKISIYTTQVGATIDTLTAIGADDARRADIRDQIPSRQETNNAGSV
jgi:chaperonin GroES